ncbi:hypothetical protein KHA80_13930 [Anaerobacillus sp. HL2]|nr:hypothetical protein KHA80_13930 [Anaerobacillus sp. HL2]
MTKMKKKLIAVITATALVLGIGSVALANSDSEKFLITLVFKGMLPFMQQMHPDMDEEQLGKCITVAMAEVV